MSPTEPSLGGLRILAPLRGVTIRAFRETFADVIAEAGFTEAVTPFISAMPGLDPLKDRELAASSIGKSEQSDSRTILPVTPQFIGKDPNALRTCLLKVREAGYDTADLNAGCPFPMVRNKGRGSGLMRMPDVLRRMLEVGCKTMGEGKFSLKIRLGVDRPDELIGLMPLINAFPLRYLTVHARTARQMYEGRCDVERLREVERAAQVPVVENGDIPFPPVPDSGAIDQSEQSTNPNNAPPVMIGRGFVRYLGTREDADALVRRYVAASQRELSGDRPVLGRMKELLAYWKDLSAWRRRWNVLKICRSVDELLSILSDT